MVGPFADARRLEHYLNYGLLSPGEVQRRLGHPMLVFEIGAEQVCGQQLELRFRSRRTDEIAALWQHLERLRVCGKRYNGGGRARVVLAVRSNDLDRGRVTVGRSRASDIWIGDERVSKLHAYFEADRAGYVVADAGSRNGTQLNGRPLDPQTPAPIVSGDLVGFGPFGMKFFTPRRFQRYIADLLEDVIG